MFYVLYSIYILHLERERERDHWNEKGLFIISRQTLLHFYFYFENLNLNSNTPDTT
jgi:hypothetical protein